MRHQLRGPGCPPAGRTPTTSTTSTPAYGDTTSASGGAYPAACDTLPVSANAGIELAWRLRRCHAVVIVGRPNSWLSGRVDPVGAGGQDPDDLDADVGLGVPVGFDEMSSSATTRSTGTRRSPRSAVLARHTATLDATYRAVLARLPANTAVSVDDAGKVHVAGVKAIEEPASLVELRKRVAAMMPRVDISEAILEVLGWYPPFLAGLTSISGSGSRLADMDITVAACLTGQALNITYTPIAVPGVPSLERHRIGYVDHTFLRAENYAAANPTLVTAQAGIGFAQALGGGLVAAIDGMRFVVPVPSIYARPNKKYFGPKRGITWLNKINDQSQASKVMISTRFGLCEMCLL